MNNTESRWLSYIHLTIFDSFKGKKVELKLEEEEEKRRGMGKGTECFSWVYMTFSELKLNA